MMSKKVRTEYMKRFREPKWETFSKCYEDSLKYRLTRRVMEHTHKPWFWEGWDGRSDSSGCSTPRPSRNKVVPLSLPRSSSEGQQRLCELGVRRISDEADGTGEDAVAPPADAIDDKILERALDPPLVDPTLDNGPVGSTSSDGEPVNPPPKRRHRRRTPRSEPDHQDNKTNGRKQRAKSQPPSCSRDTSWSAVRPDWPEKPTTQRHSDQSSALRRARSADLDKIHRLHPAASSDDRWMTEYMRCFSARLR